MHRALIMKHFPTLGGYHRIFVLSYKENDLQESLQLLKILLINIIFLVLIAN